MQATTTAPATKSKTPFCPNKEELVELYTSYPEDFIRKHYTKIKNKYPLKHDFTQPRCLTQYQFMEFIKSFGLPEGFDQSDFPLLKDVTLY